MRIESTISKQIEARLREFVSQVSNESPYHERLAARFDALPLFVDWEETRAIRSNGEIISFKDDDPNAAPSFQLEEDPRWLTLALFQGAKKYPELRALIPPKPAGAMVCPHCEGVGEFGLLDPAMKEVVCYCGGVGWLPKDYPVESYT